MNDLNFSLKIKIAQTLMASGIRIGLINVVVVYAETNAGLQIAKRVVVEILHVVDLLYQTIMYVGITTRCHHAL